MPTPIERTNVHRGQRRLEEKFLAQTKQREASEQSLRHSLQVNEDKTARTNGRNRSNLHWNDDEEERIQVEQGQALERSVEIRFLLAARPMGEHQGVSGEKERSSPTDVEVARSAPRLRRKRMEMFSFAVLRLGLHARCHRLALIWPKLQRVFPTEPVPSNIREGIVHRGENARRSEKADGDQRRIPFDRLSQRSAAN